MPRRRSSGGCGGGGSFGRLPDAVIGDVFDFLPLRSLQNVDCCSLFLREVVRRYADDCAVQRRRAFGSGALSLPWMITSDAAPTILAASPRTRKGGVRGGGGGCVALAKCDEDIAERDLCQPRLLLLQLLFLLLLPLLFCCAPTGFLHPLLCALLLVPARRCCFCAIQIKQLS